MATRSTKVTVRNLTAFPLRHVSDSLEGGIWTEPLRPPAVIPAGATMWWESESDGIATGTEGRASYAIGGTGSLVDWYWNNPYVGMNGYQQSIGPGFGMSFSEGLGNDATPTYTIAPDTPVVVPDFLPSRNALQFTNHFPPSELAHVKMPDPFSDISIGNAANGLCGGMVYATTDYYHDGSRAPVDPTAPPAGHPLFVNIVGRLVESFDIPDGVFEYLNFMNPVYGDSDNLIDNGRAWAMAHVQWPQIKASIDAGQPCPIGLIMVKSILPTDLGQNHQVMVYGYKLTGNTLRLRIYDPNSAGTGQDDVIMTLDMSRTDERIVVNHNVNVDRPIYCFFVTKYRPRTPVGGIARLPLSLRQFVENHDFDPDSGIASHMRTRAVDSVTALVGTP